MYIKVKLYMCNIRAETIWQAARCTNKQTTTIKINNKKKKNVKKVREITLMLTYDKTKYIFFLYGIS